jgi:hypothetical protein
MAIRRDSKGRFAGSGGGGSAASKRNAQRGKSSTGSRGQRAEAIASLDRSKAGLRSRARDTNKALPKDGSELMKSIRSSEAKRLRQDRASINQLRKDVRGSASEVGKSLGGKRKKLKVNR